MGNCIDMSPEEIESELLAKHPEYFYIASNQSNHRKTNDPTNLPVYPDNLIDVIYPKIMGDDVKFGWYLPNFRNIFRKTPEARKRELCKYISEAIESSETSLLHASFDYMLFSRYNEEHPGTISADAFIEILHFEAERAFSEAICSLLKFNPKTPSELIRLITVEKGGRGIYDETALKGIITDSLFSYITAPPEHREYNPNQSIAAKMYLPDGKLKDPWRDYRLRKS